MSDPPPATRIDLDLGVREVFTFFGPHDDRLAGTSHLPTADILGGVVVCSSICSDFTKNYRREVIMARELAACGLAVQRFHYRGTGNSDGDTAEMTFETMRADALAAAEQLRSLSGVDAPGFLGTRMGAIVATSAADAIGPVPLVVIEPIIEPVKFFREGYRARMVRDIKEGSAVTSSNPGLLAELDANGMVDVLGYSIYRPLYTTLVERSLTSELTARPLFLVQMGGSELRAEYLTFLEYCSERGVPVEVALVGKSEDWWFVVDEDAAGPGGSLPPIADWLLGAVATP